jgi:hypothetical protein
MKRKTWTGLFVVVAVVAAGSWYLSRGALSGADGTVEDATYECRAS